MANLKYMGSGIKRPTLLFEIRVFRQTQTTSNDLAGNEIQLQGLCRSWSECGIADLAGCVRDV